MQGIGRRQTQLQKLAIAGDDADGIVEVMSDAAGEAAYRFHFL